jgi:hypothetical protein
MVTINNGNFIQQNGTFKVGSELPPLVLYLDASNVSSYSGSGTTWYDISEYGNNATLVNGPTYSPYNGGSIVFDGVNDQATINYNANSFLIGTGDFTMNFWYNMTVPNLNAKLFNLDIFDNPGCLTVGPGSNAVNRVELVIGQFQVINANVTQSANTWYNMTVRRQSGQASIFLNGSILTLTSGVTSSAMTSSINSTSNPIIAKENFNGKIARIELYKGVALSNSEISQSYESLKNTYANVVTTNLTHLFDAGNTSSYPGSGSLWTNLAGSNNLALVASPTFISSGEASRFVFNGTSQWASGSGYLGNATDRRISTLSFILNFAPLANTFNDYKFFGGQNNPTTLLVGSSTNVNTINYNQFTQGATNFFADVIKTSTGYPLITGTNYMMTYVSTTASVSLYVNGSFVVSSSEPFSATGTFSSATEIHGYAVSDNRTNFISMSLAHIMFYSSSLSQTQITQNYYALRTRYGI